jgi:hypothetical protein
LKYKISAWALFTAIVVVGILLHEWAWVIGSALGGITCNVMTYLIDRKKK